MSMRNTSATTMLHSNELRLLWNCLLVAMTIRIRKLPDKPISKMKVYPKVKDIFSSRLRRSGGENFEPTC